MIKCNCFVYLNVESVTFILLKHIWNKAYTLTTITYTLSSFNLLASSQILNSRGPMIKE